MVALNMIKSLKYLAIGTTIANILQIGGILLIFNDLRQNLPPISSRDLIADYHGWPIYFSTVIFSFEGIAIVGNCLIGNESKIVNHDFCILSLRTFEYKRSCQYTSH